MTYRYFDGRPPTLEDILARKESFRCDLWREADLMAVFDAPAQLSMTERLALFSLVLGRGPRRAVEIGSYRGGSARIIVHAMDLLDAGALVMIDPAPQLAPGLWERIAHRATLITEPSPAAFAAVDGNFDFAFIDAMHTEENIYADLTAVAGRLTPGGIVLLHDVLYPPLQAGVRRVLRERPELIDCGELCRNASFDNSGMSWGGLGMVRKRG